MPSFTQADLNELQVATDLKSVLQVIPNKVGKTNAQSITVTYDYMTSDLSYEFTDVPQKTTTK